MKHTLSEVKTQVHQLANKIGASKKHLPAYGNTMEDCQPFIEIDGQFLYYLAKERGEELFKYVTITMDELLYYVFKDVTFTMATDYEVKNRINGRDCRRGIFAEQERLLVVLSENWKLKKQMEHERLLLKHPFDDNTNIRVAYYKQLVKSGKQAGNEWLLACKKYPLVGKV